MWTASEYAHTLRLDEIDIMEASLTYNSELPTDVGLKALDPLNSVGDAAK